MLAWLTLSLLAVAACGDDFDATEEQGRCEGDASLPCNEDPWVCEEGTNCWADNAGSFGCFDIGTTGLAEPCQAVSGVSTCGQDMVCVQVMGETEGHCRAFCDSSDPCKICPDSKNCVPVTFQSGQALDVCLPL